MPTLLLRLKGPMQSWGTTSRFTQRDTCKEPSKSGVLGLLSAAIGIDRENWDDLLPLTELKMGVRHDQPGVLRKDYQTAGCANSDTIIQAKGSQSKDGLPSDRYYLADAAFLIGLEGNDHAILETAHEALRDPKWVLGLGRKSYLPSEDIYLDDGILNLSLRNSLSSYPWLGKGDAPDSLLFSFESSDNSGRLMMDQPLACFAERQFGSRFVNSEWLSIKEVADVLE